VSGMHSRSLNSKHAWKPVQLPPLPAEPLVSILVPSYNYERYVGECLRSILRQSYGRFEVIVSDDGSTDSSAQTLEAWTFADTRICLIQEPHGGMAAALNRAWRQSRGEIVCLLDADDTYLPDKLECVVQAFRSQPQVGYVIHRTVRTDAVGRPRGILPLLNSIPSGWCLGRVLQAGGVLADVPPTSTLSFRREILERVFPISEEFQGYAELVIQRLAPCLTNVQSLDRALATWRLHNANDANPVYLDSDHIRRELRILEQLWHFQRSYLETLDPQLAAALQAISRSDYYSRLRYALARRECSPDAGRFHRDLVESPDFQDRPAVDRWFWKIAPSLPRALVDRIFNFLMTQGRAKELISHIRDRT
jgi:glycosyltransferase involved in cell wall biosynthesis